MDCFVHILFFTNPPLQPLRLLPPGAVEPPPPNPGPGPFPVPCIRSHAWDAIDEVDLVFEQASAALKVFRGCLSLYNGGNRLSLGTVYEINGMKRGPTRSTKFDIVVKRQKSDWISPQDFRRYLDLANSREWLTSALIEMSSNPDWFSLYRTIEAIEEFFGSEAKMVKSSIVDGPRLKLIKRMANSFRHLPGGVHKPPTPPISLGDASTEVSKALRAVIASI